MEGNALTLPKTTFAPNEEIQLDFTASALLPKNTWVGLIPENVGHGSTARNDQHDTSFQRSTDGLRARWFSGRRPSQANTAFA